MRAAYLPYTSPGQIEKAIQKYRAALNSGGGK